ncbi:hypothetical protein ABID65_008712 [Bradyrhizobium sp. S3.9.2]
MWWPAIGGLFVGAGGLIEPRALGVGYDIIGDLLNDNVVVSVALLILLVKSAIWIVALASGTSGGVLAPLLIFGGCVGWLEGQLLPGPHGAWALVGMAAMMGGTMRSPLTGILFAVELTGDFPLLGSLLIATSASYALTVLLLKRSILTEKIARRGQHVVREYDIDPFELLRVNEVMVTDVDTLPTTMTVGEAMSFFSGDERRHKSNPLIDAGGQVSGLVGRADVLRWRARTGVTSCGSDGSGRRRARADRRTRDRASRRPGCPQGYPAHSSHRKVRREAALGLHRPWRRSPSEKVTALNEARL